MPTVAMYALLTVVLMGGGLYAFHVTERFLIEDARFALEGSEDTVSLSVAGASNASVKAMQAVFQDDLGKSVYLLPLNDRRKGLRKVDWVRDATVARLWPNRLMVRVWERTPVAFVPMNGAGYGLIDAEGVLLAPVSARFRLPVLHGLNPSSSDAERLERVGRMLKATDDLGTAVTQDLSEIDVSDKDNLRVTQPYGRSVLTLMLGDRNFAQRYKNFKQHFEEIRRRLPDAVTLDLRLEDRITVVQ